MFGPYRIEELLGRGGMGEVHRAHDTEHDRVVALKRLSLPLADDEAMARFRRESMLAASLDGPHVTTVYDYGEVDGQLYLAMRLVEGTDLRRLLLEGPLAPERAMTILSQVATALDAAHAAGIVHRDIKPSNILLDEDGDAYLADFGIAKSLAPDATSITRTGELGTLDYMAPERLMNRPADHRADVYALACVLFECLTGRKPFPADDSAGKLAAQLGDAPPAPSMFDWHIPRAVDIVVATGMDKEPDRRYPSAGELMTAASRAFSQQVTTAPITAPFLADGPEQGHIMDAIVAVATRRVGGDGARADECPYPGLRSFAATDSELFYGREHAITDVLVRLSRQSASTGPLLVVGASGTGKSSLLRAGVLPALAATERPWPQLVTTPGPHPVQTLAARLGPIVDADVAGLARWMLTRPGEFGTLAARLAERGERLVLVVDQFEELFTAAVPGEREAFATLLASAWPALVVLAVRADFVDRCLRLPALRPALASPYPLGPLTALELERVIVEPAHAAGLRVEDGLVDRLITDIGARDAIGYDPGALPRLAHALRQIWQNRTGATLTLKGYQDTGGVDRAVALTADGVYNRLSEPDQVILRNTLLRMVTVLDGGGVARRKAPRAEIAEPVLAHLVAARLVTAEADGVMLAHDALLTAWPRLREWVEEDRQSLAVRQHLGQATAAWQNGGRDAGELYRGARLATTLEWAQGRTDLTDVERDFLRESRRVRQRTTRRLRVLVAGLAVFLVAALVAGLIAVVKWGEATDQADNAESRLLAAESLANADTNPVDARRKALDAWQHSQTQSARGALLSNTTYDYPITFHTGLDQANAVDLSPDGRYLAAGGPDGKLTVLDTRTGKPVADFDGHTDQLSDVEFSPDGSMLATAQESPHLDEGVRIWSIPSGRLLHVLNAGDFVTWRPDGRALASPGSDGVSIGVSSWDPRTGKAIAWLTTPYPDPNVQPARGAYSQDGKRFAVGRSDGDVELWDTATATLVQLDDRHVKNATENREKSAPARYPDVAFNNDLLLSASYLDGKIRFADATTGKPDGRALDTGSSSIWLNFTADGNHVITLSASTVRLDRWNIVTRRQSGGYAQAPGEHGVGDTVLVALGASTSGVVAGQIDGDVVLWPNNPGWHYEPAESVYRVAFSPDGHELSALAVDGVYPWDTATGKAESHLSGGLQAVAYLPNGTRVIVTSNGPGAVILTPPDGKEETIELDRDGIVDADLAVSPDGRLIAVKIVTLTAGGDKETTVLVLDSRSHQRRAVINLGLDIVGVPQFSPDGERLLANVTAASTTSDPVGDAEGIRTWDTSDFSPARTLTVGSDANFVITPDGDELIIGSGTRLVVRDAHTGKELRHFDSHGGQVRALALSPDGRTLATGTTSETTIRLWDLASGQEIATLTGHTAGIEDLEFSPDGSRLASASDDSDVGVWTVRPQDAVDQICDDLTRAGEKDLGSLGCH